MNLENRKNILSMYNIADTFCFQRSHRSFEQFLPLILQNYRDDNIMLFSRHVLLLWAKTKVNFVIK